MRKSVKNDKVIKAITIGLATMIAATSMPMNVYAEDAPAPVEDPEVEEDAGQVEETHEEVESVQVEANDVSSEDVGAAQISADNLTGGQLQDENIQTPLIDAALAATSDADIEAALNLTAAYIDGAKAGDLNGAVKEDITGVKNDLNALNDLVTNPVKITNEVDGVGEKVVNDLTVDPFALTKGDVLETDENGDLAYDSETQAPKCLDENNKLQLVDENIVGSEEESPRDTTDPQIAAVNENYNESLKAIENKDLPTAEEYARKAEAQVEASQKLIDTLRTGIKDSAAAQKAVEQAQKKADQLNAARNAYYEQYNALMIEYFTEVLGNKTVYNDDDTLNAAASAAKLTKSQIINKAERNNTTICELGRDLMKKMVYFSLMNDGVKKEDIEFGANADDTCNLPRNEKNQTKDAREGEVNGKTVTLKDTYQINWAEYKSGNGGRDHRLKVVYKDKDENQHTEYYNYIFKHPEKDNLVYDAETRYSKDLSKGIIYLVKEDANSRGTIQTIGALDDYDLLQEAKAAKIAVDDAAREVSNLRKQILKIASRATANITVQSDPEVEGLSIDDMSSEDLDKLQTILEAKLAKAQEALDNNKTNLKALNKLIGYLKEVNYGEEDPGNGGGNEDTDPAGGDEDPGTSGGTPVYDPGTGTLSIPGYVIPPISVPGPSGVAGVRRGTSSGVAGVRSDNIEDKKDIVRKIVEPKKKVETVNNKKGKKITNPAVPLAATPFEDGAEMSWWWLLIIFLLGATGKKMYDEHKKKVEAEKAAKNIDK